MLCAAIDFIVRDLGLRRIYYHSPVSNRRLQGQGAEGAPRSLYTDLPRRFCFERTPSLPAFLRRRKKIPDFWMHRLCL